MEVEGDFELLKAWRKGDSTAGSTLLRRHFMSVYSFFINKVDDQAEDLTQRTFLACVEDRDRFREESTFKTYLLGIARNLLLMYLRQKGRWDRRFQLGEMSVDGMGESPSLVAADREEEKLLLVALRRIPLDLQTVVELFYWEDLTTSEVAGILEIPPGTVKTRLMRARKVLKQKLAEMNVPEQLQRTTIDNLEIWAKALREKIGQEFPEEDEETTH